MHEDLLGYLLGALEPDEMQRVAEWLRRDPAAREELAKLESSLRPLEEGLEPPEHPPEDLVARTLASLPPLPSPDQALPTPDSDRSQREAAAMEDSLGAGLAPMHCTVESSDRPAVTWMDWAGGAVAAAVLLGLLLPSLAQGRFEARKVACQDQLRQFGTALTQFVMRNQQNQLPAVSESGPEAFAGKYAVELYDQALMEDPASRWCPSVDLPSEEETSLIDVHEVVSSAELYLAPVDRLRQIQRFVGGHYAYNLGVVDQDRFHAPRYESRSSFAVMSDAPLYGMQGATLTADRIGHSGVGINVLYEDGRVQFIALPSLESMRDHPLLNHHGRVEAGVNVDDAALAPSWQPPFIDVKQR